MKDDWIFRGRTHLGRKWIIAESMEEIGILFSSGVDPATIGRCIGRRDKNKVFIFEGDVVEDCYGRTFHVATSIHFQQTRLLPVNEKARKFYESKYGVEIFSWMFPDMHLTVIGDIYDNPELMEEAKQLP